MSPLSMPAPESASKVSPEQSARVMHVLEDYLAKLERGIPPHPEELLHQYPELAEPLKEYLASLEFLHRAAVNLRSSEQPRKAAAVGEVTELGQLGDFRILREVGRGGMGIVYEADQISLARRVALKVLPFAAALDAKQLQRFKNEAQAAAHLHHQNIVPVYAVGCERGVHFYAMQYIEGQTLAALIAERRHQAGKGDRGWRIEDREPKPAAQGTTIEDPGPRNETSPLQPLTSNLHPPSSFFRTVAQLGVQAAEALEHAHQLGVVHRDIKPANLLVDVRSNLWITDFGLAQFQSNAGLTLSGDLVGTLRYMSPEQALGKRSLVDHRTDIYSLGVTLYELLTLQPAMTGRDREELLQQIAFQEPRPPRQLNRAVTADLETIVLKAIAKTPDERYATARELADDLRRFLDDKPILARRPTLMHRARKWSRRHQAVVATAGMALVVALVMCTVGILLLWREKQQTELAYQAEATAHEAEIQQRERAETNVHLALDTLERIYLRVAEEKFPRDPKQRQEDRELLTQALQFYKQFAEANHTEQKVRDRVCRAYQRMGEIHRLLGQLREAKEAFHHAIALYEQLASEFPTEPQYRGDMARSHGTLSLLLRESGEPPAAEYHSNQAFDVQTQLVKEFPTEPRYRRDLSITHSHMAKLQMQAGDLVSAKEHYRQALDLDGQLVAAFPTAPEYREGLALGYSALAAFYMSTKRGHPETAEERQRKAIDLQTQLVAAFPTEPRYRRQLGLSHSMLGLLLRQAEKHAEAADHLRKAVTFQTQLVAEFPMVPECADELAGSHQNLGLLLHYDEPDEAEKHYRLCVDLRTRLVVDFPERPRFQSELGSILNNLANLLRKRGRFNESRELLEQALPHHQAALKSNSKNPGYVQLLHKHCLNLTATLVALGSHAEASRAAEELPHIFPQAGRSYWLAACCFMDCVPLAEKDASLAVEQRQAAVQTYTTKAKEFLQEAVKRCRNDPVSLEQIAQALATYADARFRDPKQAVELAERCVELAPQNGKGWNTLGVARYRTGDWKAAVVALEKSMQLRNGGDG